MNYSIPTFFIKKNLQKSEQTGIYFSDVINDVYLEDICLKITGVKNFNTNCVDNNYKDDCLDYGYNKGRLIVLKYRDSVNFISISEKEIKGRNSSIQSVPTAFNIYYNNTSSKKNLYYYFINDVGNASTEYQLLFYRLMKTVGFIFLNDIQKINISIQPFMSIEDIMYSRKSNAGKNRSNNSTYITKSSIVNFDIYGKTYGANKYETSMICYAISILAKANQQITLYEMLDGNLKELPVASLNVISAMDKIKVVPTDLQLEKNVIENKTNIRSPKYIFNLLEKLGPKKCACCECEIPEIIQGAHIYPVSVIKNKKTLSINEKIRLATDGDNGIWLCENHHKLFDQGILLITNEGNIIFRDDLTKNNIEYLNKITTLRGIDKSIMTTSFINYLELRNSLVI